MLNVLQVASLSKDLEAAQSEAEEAVRSIEVRHKATISQLEAANSKLEEAAASGQDRVEALSAEASKLQGELDKVYFLT